LPRRDFAWNSGWQTAVNVDASAKVWTCEMRIPLKAFGAAPPTARTRWQVNFFRCDRAHDAFQAFNPTLTGSFHVPERFGVLEFVE
jgi:hypothetical protein